MQQKYAFVARLWMQFEEKYYLCGRNYINIRCMEKMSSNVAKGLLGLVPVILCITIQELDTIGGYSACLWYKILACAAPIACMFLPSFVEYTKAQSYLLYAVMIAWLIFDITHYIL